MKHTIFAMCVLLVLSACQEEGDVNPANTNPEGLRVSLSDENGLRISEFIEDGENKTTLFSQYLFVFNSDGTVIASRSGQTINGTYVVFRDDGRMELGMTFPMNSALYELTDDWYFISQSENTLRFEDSGDTLVLTQQ